MWGHLISSFRVLILLSIVTGVVYPLTMTGIAQALFPYQANGTILSKEGKPIGSELIGQHFEAPGYFHGRPSAAGQDGYDGANSAGSNLGPTNKTLLETVEKNIEKVRKENEMQPSQAVPSDMVLASASGLDPHITPAAAYLQAKRVAKERGLKVQQVENLIQRQLEGRQFGIFGEPRINVLKLNMALEQLQPEGR